MRNGYVTKRWNKWIGFKGTTFAIATAGLFIGRISDYVWAVVALSICGLKVTEDIITRLNNKDI